MGALFVLGLTVGSFVNVCIYRMPLDQSVVRPPSRCPACNTQLRAKDLVPVLSFLIQGRKCRYCKAPISWRYAIVESLTGVAFATLFFVHGPSVALLFDAALVAALIAICAIDLEHYIIPDELNLFLVVTGILRDVWGRVTTGSWSHAAHIAIPFTEWELTLPSSVLGIVVGFTLFLAIGWLGSALFKKEALGGGDLKLAMGLGAHLGWLGAVASFYLAIVFGAVVGIGLIALGVKKRGEYIPFGPAMVLGALAIVYAGYWVVPLFLRLYSLSSGVGPVAVRSWP
ncbi:MAG TPA: prepilin peptidase [Armatimonadota bacterium]|nr:prepilin peptidase [Armatimonadota bacterium]HOM80248.1 prepilin peptidase [Armatimonadota bacterium]HOQ28901.1 prepilin peptidase [Armatimonadota bacterium]HPO72151.1 prepilin peptidase [Armatimonadota bacterium]HPT97209.1 prepilin peptidase [Armatimonadota bacterium]